MARNRPLGVITMRLCKAKLIIVGFSIFYLSGSFSPTLCAGDPAYVRVESCEYTDCLTTDCGWIPGWLGSALAVRSPGRIMSTGPSAIPRVGITFPPTRFLATGTAIGVGFWIFGPLR